MFDFRSRSQNMSSPPIETESNDSDTADSYQVVSSTTDDLFFKTKGNIIRLYNILILEIYF